MAKLRGGPEKKTPCILILIIHFRQWDPSFEKITKSRCSSAWISAFSFLGALNLTDYLYFYPRVWKKVHTLAKNTL